MNDSGSIVDEWVSETTAAERVEAVVMGVQGPRPVSWLAQVAVAATVTTQEVIDELSSDGVVKVIGSLRSPASKTSCRLLSTMMVASPE